MRVKIEDDLSGRIIESPIICEMAGITIGEDGKRYLNYFGKAKLDNGDVVKITIKKIKLDITQINLNGSEYRERPTSLFDCHIPSRKITCFIPFTINDEIVIERCKNNNKESTSNWCCNQNP